MTFTWSKFRARVIRTLQGDNQTEVDLDDLDMLNEEIGLGLSMYCVDAYEIFVPYAAGTASGSLFSLKTSLGSVSIFEPDQLWVSGREMTKFSYDEFRQCVDQYNLASGGGSGSAAKFAHIGNGQVVVDAVLSGGTAIAAAGYALHPAYGNDEDLIQVDQANIPLATIYCAKQLMSSVVSDQAAVARLARYDRAIQEGTALAKSRNMARYYAGVSRN